MAATEYAVGDTVKVSFEGKVNRVLDTGNGHVELRIESGPDDDYQYVTTDTANVEKVAPSIEVFGPGAVLRHRDYDPATYRVLVLSDDFVEFGGIRKGRVVTNNPKEFTSREYERITVG